MFINLKLLSHPMNWIIILLMLVIAGMFGHLLLTTFDQEPSGTKKSPLPAGLASQVPDTLSSSL